MSATSESLKKPGKIVSDAVNELVKSYLKEIDMTIKSASKKLGWNLAFHSLPTWFDLGGLDKISGQALVYAMIIDDLKKRKLEPKIMLEKDPKSGHEKTTLVIRFEVTPNQADISVMTEFIKEHTIQRSDLEKFGKGELGSKS